MRKVGLVAFCITTGVLVPAALHQLTAGPEQVARLIAPGASAITIDGATIAASVDRSIVDAGGQVHVSLTSRAPAGQRVTVDVLVYEATGSNGGRVSNPPDRLARKTVTLDGGAAQVVAFTLPGFRGQEMDGRAAFGDYTIFVMRPALATAFETLRHRAAKVANRMDDDSGRYGDFETAFWQAGRPPEEGADPAAPVLGKPGEIARLQVQTRAGDSPVALKVPDTATVGQPFTVAITVTNPTRKTLAHVNVSLGVPQLLQGEYLGLKDDQVAIADSTLTIGLKPRETRVIEFRVTARARGTLGLYAQTTCETDTEWQACAAVSDGQLDAIEVAPGDAATHPVITAGTDDAIRGTRTPFAGVR